MEKGIIYDGAKSDEFILQGKLGNSLTLQLFGDKGLTFLIATIISTSYPIFSKRVDSTLVSQLDADSLNQVVSGENDIAFKLESSSFVLRIFHAKWGIRSGLVADCNFLQGFLRVFPTDKEVGEFLLNCDRTDFWQARLSFIVDDQSVEGLRVWLKKNEYFGDASNWVNG